MAAPGLGPAQGAPHTHNILYLQYCIHRVTQKGINEAVPESVSQDRAVQHMRPGPHETARMVLIRLEDSISILKQAAPQKSLTGSLLSL